jgi:2-C-methyl-D-erythritol 2,4-cyclodiphosphate synthase
MIRIGYGTDIHRLTAGRPLVVGGVSIDSDRGAEGHSDADVLLHAVTDALLGSLALGDIGSHFPNDEPRWQNAESTVFVRYAVGLLKEQEYSVANVDCVIDLESPRLRPYIDAMRQNIAIALEIGVDKVSVKAKSGEKVDSVGELRAIRAQAVVLICDDSP